jgi:plasmid segregation protein ParM
MALLAVDAGRSEVEFKSSGLMGAFPSVVAEAIVQKSPALCEEDLEIEIDDKKWWVGRLAQVEGAGRNRSNFSKTKVDDVLKVQVIASIIYAGIANDDVDLGIIVPIDSYTEEEQKKLKKLLRGIHEVKYSLVTKAKKMPKVRECSIKINDRILISQEGAMA